MPKITAGNTIITCEKGDNLRQICLKNKIPLHNGKSKWINCRGIGTCGTCAVMIEGEVSEINWKEKTRLSLPPHSPEQKLRLACQTQVLDDIIIKKYDGFWGQGDTNIW